MQCKQDIDIEKEIDNKLVDVWNLYLELEEITQMINKNFF